MSLRDWLKAESPALTRFRAARAWWQQGLEAGQEPLFLLRADGQILSVNQAAARWADPSVLPLLGQPFSALLTAEARRAFAGQWDELVAQGSASRLLLNFIGRGLQAVQWLPLAHGPVLALLHSEVEREPDEPPLPVPKRLAPQTRQTLDRLASGLAHSFNNTLMGITGYCELAMSDVPAHHPIQARLHTIHQIADKASELIRQLLAYSAKQPLTLEPLSLRALVYRQQAPLQAALGSRIALELQLDDEGLVMADSGQLDKLVMDLLLTLRDAHSGAGRLRIRTRDFLVGEALAAAFDDLAPGAYAMLCIADDGAGMPPEVLEALFEPFYSLKERGTGRGLGLATVYGTVKQLRGYIGVASQADLGSCFTVLLPLCSPIEPLARSPVGLRGKQFLLLLQDRAWCHYAAQVLREAGASVQLGWGALSRVRHSRGIAPAFDGVLSDSPDRTREQARLIAAGLGGAYQRLLYVSELCAELSGQRAGMPCLPKLIEPDELVQRVEDALIAPRLAPDT